jgi:alkanesulfonate monooxygenase SsuD/methylene tetrahydromethanopterin reductase-like flavin-dependent oxidoreductase (luciferase family)
MEFGIQIRGTWDEVLTAARWAEDRGDVAAVGLPDHYLRSADSPDDPAWDNLTHIAALASHTSSIELMSLVSPVTFRHPGSLYKVAVSIDEISRGRFTLGLGAGWMEEEFTMFGIPYPDLATRMEMYEEAMAYLRAAITPGAHGFDGNHYHLDEFDPHPHPVGLRLAGGGMGGPKARKITARYADEYNLYAKPPEEFAKIVNATRDVATEIGRDPDEIFWSSAAPGMAAKKEVDYRRLLEKASEFFDRPLEHLETRFDERGYPHGSGAKPAEMIAALEEAGCERFYVQAFLVDADDTASFDEMFDAYMGR